MRETVRKELERTDSELRGILQRQSDAAARRSELDDKIKRLGAEKEGLVYERMGLEHRRDSCLEKMEQYGQQLDREAGSLWAGCRTSPCT